MLTQIIVLIVIFPPFGNHDQCLLIDGRAILMLVLSYFAEKHPQPTSKTTDKLRKIISNGSTLETSEKQSNDKEGNSEEMPSVSSTKGMHLF